MYNSLYFCIWIQISKLQSSRRLGLANAGKGCSTVLVRVPFSPLEVKFCNGLVFKINFSSFLAAIQKNATCFFSHFSGKKTVPSTKAQFTNNMRLFTKHTQFLVLIFTNILEVYKLRIVMICLDFLGDFCLLPASSLSTLPWDSSLPSGLHFAKNI